MTRRRAPLVLLQIANLLAGVANATVMILIPWLVLDLTGSAGDAGLVGAVSAIPGIFVSPFVGALVDRFGRRRVSMVSDALSVVSVCLFPLAALAGRLDLTMILGLAVFGATFDPAGYTARKALIPDVVAAGGFSTDRINGFHEGIFAAGWVIGPALGALGISTIGVVSTFWVTAAAFLGAIVAVWFIRVPEAADGSRAASGEAHERFWVSSVRGAQILWADKPLRVLSLAIALLSAIYYPTEAVLMPVHFQDLAEPGGYGFTITMLALGGVVGAFSYGWLTKHVTRHRMAVGIMLVVTASIIPMAFLPPLAIFATAGFFLGLGWGPMEPLINSLVQTRVPAHVQGRVYGVQISMYYATPPIGLLIAGWAVDNFGVQIVYAVIGALLAVVSLLIATLPSLQGLDDDAPPPNSAIL